MTRTLCLLLACAAVSIAGCKRSESPPVQTGAANPSSNAPASNVPLADRPAPSPQAQVTTTDRSLPPAETSAPQTAPAQTEPHTPTPPDRTQSGMPTPGQANDHSNLAKEPSQR